MIGEANRERLSTSVERPSGRCKSKQNSGKKKASCRYAFQHNVFYVIRGIAGNTQHLTRMWPQVLRGDN